MFTSFHQYCRIRRPMLDTALRAQIAAILPRASSPAGCDLRPALAGGKKLRGILLGLIAEILGADWDSALPRAVAVELIQTATLIHDDFVDQDRIRRCLPAVWTLAGARKAVLMGDVIFASAIRMMSEIGREEGRIVSRAIAEIANGALMEPTDPIGLMGEMAAGTLKSDVYAKIILLKTAVLFEAACELGAVSASAAGWIRKRCRRYGACIGEAYQMADDRKEIKLHLANGAINAREMAVLAPAVLCFAEEARPLIAPILAGSCQNLTRPLRAHLDSTARRMERGIAIRLEQAAGEMRDVFESKCHGTIGLRAPFDLLAMFNLSEN
jgi:hypothetical protein